MPHDRRFTRVFRSFMTVVEEIAGKARDSHLAPQRLRPSPKYLRSITCCCKTCCSSQKTKSSTARANSILKPSSNMVSPPMQSRKTKAGLSKSQNVAGERNRYLSSLQVDFTNGRLREKKSCQFKAAIHSIEDDPYNVLIYPLELIHTDDAYRNW